MLISGPKYPWYVRHAAQVKFDDSFFVLGGLRCLVNSVNEDYMCESCGATRNSVHE